MTASENVESSLSDTPEGLLPEGDNEKNFKRGSDPDSNKQETDEDINLDRYIDIFIWIDIGIDRDLTICSIYIFFDVQKQKHTQGLPLDREPGSNGRGNRKNRSAVIMIVMMRPSDWVRLVGNNKTVHIFQYIY